ncbi:3-deoxy-D-manno-octulosonic acid transferase [hydrothermal vent metagenome]|uniref:3-deoxy-D-manno-octulosonic acid transferase n=1 Tax=hydrothermal vent metagenome TaxID=652676 RepID=A0A3B0VZE3_9ZZZZ
MIYQLLIRLFSPFICLLITKDSIKKQGGGNFIKQRLGLDYPALPQVSQRIWIHCASVGEVKAAEPLIRALESTHHILVTTNTPTGKQQISNLFQNKVDHCYLPLDWPFAIKHFLRNCLPTECWIVETEIWPNLYRICAQHAIPLSIINGRLSPKTLNAPSWLKKSYQQSLLKVNKILARSQTEADRFIALGAPPHIVTVLGNLKYAQIQAVPHASNPMPRDYVLLASSHHDEELHIAQQWKNLQRPELLVIVPRHPNRSEAIQKQLLSLFPDLKIASKNQHPNAMTTLFLDDRMSKLMPLFEHAKLVIMGGSFVSKGGHNILEPATYQKAIITGSNMSDFIEEMALLQNHSGIIQCQNVQALSKILPPLLNDQKQRQILGKNAFKAIQTQQSILQDYLNQLL